MASISQKVKLADLVKINPKLTKLPGSEDLVSFIPMAAVDADTASISTIDEVRRYSEVKNGYTTFEDGDILVAKITPCFENGKIAQVKISHSPGFGSTEFHVLRPRKDALDNRYLLHYLRQRQILLEGERRMTGSAGQRRVPLHFFENLQIQLPPIVEQRRIAMILDRARELLAKRRKSMLRLDELTRSIFYDMFGNPSRNSHRWSRIPLGKAIEFGPQNGLYKPSTAYGAGTPILRIDGFYDGAVTDLGSLKRLQISNDDLRLYELLPDDIIINRVNSIQYLGKSAIVPELVESVVFESNMMRLRVDRKLADPCYVVKFLQSDFAKSQILQSAKRAVNQASINQQDVKNIQIDIPPLQLQQRFAKNIKEIEQIKTYYHAHLAELDALFASLQYRAFRGEL